MENLSLGFTVTRTFNRDEIFKEAREIVQSSGQFLGAERAATAPADRSALDRLAKLEEEHASFATQLHVLPLTADDFAEGQGRPSRQLALELAGNRFFQVEIPILLFPRSGWAFTRLECVIEFCPGEPPGERPVIRDLFPADVWRDLLKAHQTLAVGIDENLEFRASAEGSTEAAPALSGSGRAGVGGQLRIGAGLVAGPFQYTLRRPEVRSRGRLHSEAFWRLDSRAHVDQEDVVLRVVLMVPTRRTAPVSAEAELKAYHDFEGWSADLFKDWGGAALKAFFGAGGVVTATGRWDRLA